MQNKNNTGYRIFKIAFVSLIAFISVFLICYLLFNNKPSPSKKMVVLEPAPNSILYPSKDNIKTIAGQDITLSADGIMFDVDGKKVLVKKDGSVWVVNSDGSLNPANEEITNKALLKANEYSSKSDEVKSSISQDALEYKLDLTSLSQEELDHLAKLLGLDKTELQRLIDKMKEEGKTYTLADFKRDQETAKKQEEKIEALTRDMLLQILKEAGIENVDVDALLNALLNDPRYKNDPEKFSKDIIRDGALNVLDKLGFSQDDKDSNITEDGVKVASKARYSQNDTINKQLEDYLKGATDSLSDLTSLSSQSNYERQNNQQGKISFAQSNKKGTKIISRKASDNMLTRGTIINATLVTSINTDLPGSAVAIVNQNVLDSFKMDNILIPKGTRIIGTYDSSVSYGQKRVLFSWTELIRPDGLIIQLNGYESLDNNGSGITGSVDNHWGQVVLGAGLLTLLNYADSKITDVSNIDVIKALVSNTSDSVVSIGEKLIDKITDVQPTIQIKSGTVFSIIVNDNISLPKFNNDY